MSRVIRTCLPVGLHDCVVSFFKVLGPGTATLEVNSTTAPGPSALLYNQNTRPRIFVALNLVDYQRVIGVLTFDSQTGLNKILPAGEQGIATKGLTQAENLVLLQM